MPYLFVQSQRPQQGFYGGRGTLCVLQCDGCHLYHDVGRLGHHRQQLDHYNSEQWQQHHQRFELHWLRGDHVYPDRNLSSYHHGCHVD